jgi:hypothetical protein
MNTLKTWFPVISTGLAVFFAVMWLTGSCDKPVTRPSDNELWRQKVTALNATIDVKDSIIQAISQKRHIDSVKHLKVTTGLQMREKALVAKLKAANADIKEISDSLPKVKRYVELADSTIAVKDSLYMNEVHHNFMNEKSYQKQIAEMGEKNVQQIQISNKLTTVVTDLEDKNFKLARKLERKKTGNRILLGIGGGLAAALAIITLTQ